MWYFLSSRNEGLIHVVNHDRQCHKNKRNVCGWNNFKYFRVHNNKTERDRGNEKIVEHVASESVNNLSGNQREIYFYVNTLKQITTLDRSAPSGTSSDWFGGFKHH